MELVRIETTSRMSSDGTRLCITHHHFFKCPLCGKIIKAQKGPGLRRKKCIQHANTFKHGMCHTPIHRVWSGMNERCYNSAHKQYHNYGGRGIRVCKQWRSNFLAFFKWATKHGYEHGKVIDRNNNNAGYSPSNCSFTDRPESTWNSRTTKLTPNKVKAIRTRVAAGEMQKTLAEEYGVCQSVLSQVVTRKLWNAVA